MLLVSLMLTLAACSGRGVTADAVKDDIHSDIYSESEYDSAVKTVFKYFRGFSGCSMTQIGYAGDEITAEYEQQYGQGNVIVLTSSFTTDEKAGDGSLNPNSEYDDWMWILTRENGGRWVVTDYGY